MTSPGISPEAQAQLYAALDTALNKPTAAQGFLSGIPDLSKVGEMKDKVVGILDTVLGALDVVSQYAWLIPDQYEAPLKKLTEALTKVRGWLD